MVLYPSADVIRKQQQQQQQSAWQPTLTPQSMARRPSPTDHRNNPYLSQNQQDLLLAALTSQATGRQDLAPQNDSTTSSATVKRTNSDSANSRPTMSGVNDHGLFMSPQDAELDNFNGDFTPDLDYLDGDTSFDFESADLGGEMIGALPGESIDGAAEGHEKRKSPDDNNSGEEGDPKRQETQEGEKGAKKPGRKPLTNEPTTKRKAQNRAAQRAFRERKEKHVKDLEIKVADLAKLQEADKHENGLLKAQVERLQIELREYRKRLSLNGGTGGARGSPPLPAYNTQNHSSSNPSKSNESNNFQFDFPKFGALPGSQIFGNQQMYPVTASNDVQQTSNNTTPSLSRSTTTHGSFSGPTQATQLPRANSNDGRSMSVHSGQGNRSSTGSPSETGTSFDPAISIYSSANNMHGFASTLPQMTGGDPFGDLFSPSILKSATLDGSNFFTSPQNNVSPPSFDTGNGGDNTAGFNRVFQFNGGSTASDSGSPSASSSSQWNANANSSCGTSPEPSHGSPGNKADKSAEIGGDKTITQQNLASTTLSTGNPNIMFTGNTYNIPTTNTFDPVLFGEMRDPNINGGDFTAGFFDDALNSGPYDFGSPSNLFGILQSPQQSNAYLNTSSAPANAPTPSSNLMAETDKTRDGGDDDYGLPVTQPQKPEDSGKLISCNNIWNQLQTNPDFRSGTFDLDSLCSELRAKARCSESGVVVDQEHVNDALKKLGKNDENGRFVPTSNGADLPKVMFPQENWDNVLKKLRENSRTSI